MTNEHRMQRQSRWGKLLLLGVLSVLTLFVKYPAEAAPPEAMLAVFRDSIPTIAEQYIGMPYAFGADPLHHGAADNSHLMCAIYAEAARKAGLTFPGYMTMQILLAHTVPVNPGDLQPGDLMVLNDGHAAMIYQVNDAEYFDLIYASLKRGKVFSFNSQNLVYEVYWREHLNGFYRVDPNLLVPLD